jgi:hypothetical protein
MKTDSFVSGIRSAILPLIYFFPTYNETYCFFTLTSDNIYNIPDSKQYLIDHNPFYSLEFYNRQKLAFLHVCPFQFLKSSRLSGQTTYLFQYCGQLPFFLFHHIVLHKPQFHKHLKSLSSIHLMQEELLNEFYTKLLYGVCLERHY